VGGSGGDRSGGSSGGNGTANRGNGGGGAGTLSGATGGKGGSGRIVISYPSVLLAAPTYAAGKYGQAITFNNQNATTTSNSYVTYELPTGGTANSFSLSCWVMPLFTIPNTAVNPKYAQVADSNKIYTIQTYKNSTNSGFYSDAGGSAQAIVKANLVTTGQWDHHCFVLSNVGASSSNSTSAYYFNGVSQGTSNVTTTGTSAIQTLTLGSNAWCSIDDLRIFNTSLTAAQVQGIYGAQGMPSVSSLTNVSGISTGYFTNS
jgi:hypothetical protein